MNQNIGSKAKEPQACSLTGNCLVNLRIQWQQQVESITKLSVLIREENMEPTYFVLGIGRCPTHWKSLPS